MNFEFEFEFEFGLSFNQCKPLHLIPPHGFN